MKHRDSMWYMTDHEHGPPAKAPGRPLWLAAERVRVSEGISKIEWARQLGIGRVTYDRLYDQENPPIARTVKKIADRIGIDAEQAMNLAGLSTDDQGVDVVVIRDGRHIMIQAKHIQRRVVEQQLDALRKVAAEAGKSLGDILVVTELAAEQELELHRDDRVVSFGEDPFFTVEFLSNLQPPPKDG